MQDGNPVKNETDLERPEDVKGEKKDGDSAAATTFEPSVSSDQNDAPPKHDGGGRINERTGTAASPLEKKVTIAEIKGKIRSSSQTAEDLSYAKDVTGAKGSKHISEFSHQQIVPKSPDAQDSDDEADEDDGEWQTMPAFAPYTIYDDNNRVIANEYDQAADHGRVDPGVGAKGYTRVTDDDDAKSATSMDDNTQYLFKSTGHGGEAEDEDEVERDPIAQLQATKNLLSEAQKIAYVSLCRLAIAEMALELEKMERTRKTKKEIGVAEEHLKMWGQKMMVRLYAHMDIGSDEQLMVEQLTEHGVVPNDLSSQLMKNMRVSNPAFSKPDEASAPSESSKGLKEQNSAAVARKAESEDNSAEAPPAYESDRVLSPPPYQETKGDELEVKSPTAVLESKTLDIDIRWTILCDLFLVLIADAVYDSRSRTLLERIGAALQISWTDVCRFEKRVTDALEMQESADTEDLKETDNMASRKKLALRKRYVVMGLATVGGGLVIGLSAGLVAPLIGAGLAAGFSTIGVAGTGSFLGGTAAAALITTGGTVSGGIIGHKAGDRRTKEVTTFEYRPLHNNKRVNLIITVSGWLTGKVDDVRLPFSTVDPIMGDLLTVLYDPEMLQSMGQTISILATEALTQSLQQVLGATILVGLMAALQVPILLTKLAYLIDNPWTVSCSRAWEAGLILADSLIARNLGNRPITLVGYSLGSRVIFSALKELAKKGAYGIVQNAYLFGTPVVASKDEYLRIRSIVPGRFVNGYAKNDWILAYLFRATSGGVFKVAGLAPVVDIPGLENIDVTDMVEGHMAYRQAMPKLLKRVGWITTSDTFAEIEDPDPEAQRERQRELMDAIAVARDEASKGAKTKRFGLFSRSSKAVNKANWETYDEKSGPSPTNGDSKSVKSPGSVKSPSSMKSPKAGAEAESNLLFDVEAIRAELAAASYEHSDITVKQLKTTLPPLELDFGKERELETTLPPLQLEVAKAKSTDALPGPATALELRPLPESSSSSSSHARSNGHAGLGISADITDSSRKVSVEQMPKLGTPPVETVPERPRLTSAATMPVWSQPTPLSGNSLGSIDVEHNAWAEDADEDAREMTLSFE